MICSVDKVRVREGLDTDPFAIMLHLKPIDIVLVEDCEEAVVRVRWQAHCQVWLRACRIEIASNKLEL